eukprot:TRINITY_DN11819_c0_g1_i1.p1 TRINITY_DN11819_c0_g1~~TRINITY_DN11819_c0_g1_i1.p1  ORF type:complete len:242 (+),score=40.18 TRINITY_DN11819_c0_g1_i1:1-726(+)
MDDYSVDLDQPFYNEEKVTLLLTSTDETRFHSNEIISKMDKIMLNNKHCPNLEDLEKHYDVILFYGGDDTKSPKRTSETLEKYVKKGGSVIIFRAGNEVTGSWALNEKFPHPLSCEEFRNNKKYAKMGSLPTPNENYTPNGDKPNFHPIFVNIPHFSSSSTLLTLDPNAKVLCLWDSKNILCAERKYERGYVLSFTFGCFINNDTEIQIIIRAIRYCLILKYRNWDTTVHKKLVPSIKKRD